MQQQALTNRRISLSSCRPAPLSGSINSLLIIFSPRTNSLFPSSLSPRDSLPPARFSPLPYLPSSNSRFPLFVNNRISYVAASSTPYCRPVAHPLGSRFRGPALLAAVIISCERDDDVCHIEMRSRLDSSRSPPQNRSSIRPLVMFSTPIGATTRPSTAQPVTF